MTFELLDENGKVIAPDEASLGKETAAPQLTGVRAVTDDALIAGMTPSGLATLLEEAATLKNVASYFKLAEQVEERDLHYRSVLSTRKLAVEGLDIVVEPGSDDARAIEAADLVRSVVRSAAFQASRGDLLDAVGKGTSIVELIWDTSVTPWRPKAFHWRNPRGFVFDPKDGRTPMLAPDKEGAKPRALKPGKFIIHQPKLKSGLPVRSGLAFAASWAWLLKSLSVKDWLSFIEIFGRPVITGRYKAGDNRDNIAALRRAVANLGTDARAILPEHMSILFEKDGTVTSTTDAYERLARYLDEQVSKLVLGQTLTADSGGGSGSYALGRVHGDVRSDILISDARQLAATLLRDLVQPIVVWNYGPDVAMPTLRFDVEEEEDIGAWLGNVSKFQSMGGKVSASQVRDKLGLEEPASDDDVLEAPAAPGFGAFSRQPVATPTTQTHQPAAGCPACGGGTEAHAQQRDGLDDLADEMVAAWEPLGSREAAILEQAAHGATSLEDLRDRVAATIATLEPDDLADLIARGLFNSRLAGMTQDEV